ncbi:MAG: hypothetical protein ACO3EZ_17330 [Prochlorotrichaceae cyanobacterium]|jgi:hypothetical protein
MSSLSSQFRSLNAAKLNHVIQVTRLEMLEFRVTLMKFSQQDQTLKLLFTFQDDTGIAQHQAQITDMIWKLKGILNAAHISIVEIYQNPGEQSKAECLLTVDLNVPLLPKETDPFLQLSRGLCFAR